MTAEDFLSSFAWFMIAVLVINFCLFIATQILLLITRDVKPLSALSNSIEVSNVQYHYPFISIHVPCYDEPPEIVAQTLKSLSAIKYPHYEVIVLDNNTPWEASWKPIEILCRTLGPRFRFFHVDGLTGAKAGALNLCLKMSNPAAVYVAIVDADYQVNQDFLAVAMNHISGKNIAFAQFPQAFRGADGASEAVALELEDYFSVLARQAPDIRAPLLTGTLSVISRHALVGAGGWSHSSITEDAELGVQLFKNGARGLFINRIVGRGLLPMSLDGLKIQRRRWVSGNVHTMKRAIGTAALRGRPGAASILAQLSAWPAFWLVPFAALLLGSVVSTENTIIHIALWLSALTVVSSGSMAVIRGVVDRNRQIPLRRSLVGPLGVKLALIWVSSYAWAQLVISSKTVFVKTPKILSVTGSTGANFGISVMCCLAAIAYIQRADWLSALACGLGLLSWPAALWVDKGLRRYGERNASALTVGTEIAVTSCAA